MQIGNLSISFIFCPSFVVHVQLPKAKTVTECVCCCLNPHRCLHATVLHHAGVLRHSALLSRAVLRSVCQPRMSGRLEDQPYVQRSVVCLDGIYGHG